MKIDKLLSFARPLALLLTLYAVGTAQAFDMQEATRDYYTGPSTPIAPGSDYVVGERDVLSMIASRIEGRAYGSVWEWASRIQEANPHAFVNGDPKLLIVGATLYIPPMPPGDLPVAADGTMQTESPPTSDPGPADSGPAAIVDADRTQPTAQLQTAVDIDHDAIEQSPSGKRITVDTNVSITGGDGDSISQVRTYFRADNDGRWHFVPMRVSGSDYEGLLPAPDIHTEFVRYQLLAVTSARELFKSEIYNIDIVKDEDALARLNQEPPTDTRIDVSDLQDAKDIYDELQSEDRIRPSDKQNIARESGEATPDSRVDVRSEYNPLNDAMVGFNDYVNLSYVAPAEDFGVGAGIVSKAATLSTPTATPTATATATQPAAAVPTATGGLPGGGWLWGGVAVAGGVAAASSGGGGGGGNNSSSDPTPPPDPTPPDPTPPDPTPPDPTPPDPTPPDPTPPDPTPPDPTPPDPTPPDPTPPDPTPPPPDPVTDFGTRWTGPMVCAATGDAAFRWVVDLSQTDDAITGIIAFHICPGGGRATYSVTGTATAASSVVLAGSLTSSIGPLAGTAPGSQSFTVSVGLPPDPNFAP